MNFFDILLAKKLGGSGGGGGGDAVIRTLNVSANGTYTAPSGVDGYSPVKVNVPQPSGTKEITISQNGTTTENVNDYASAQITVAVPQPSGSINITENGTVDVTDYASAVVSVPQPSGTTQITITANGTTTENVADYANAEITVAVPISTVERASGSFSIDAYLNEGETAYASATPIPREHGLSKTPKIYSFWVELNGIPTERVFVAHNFTSSYGVYIGGVLVPFLANVYINTANSSNTATQYQTMPTANVTQPTATHIYLHTGTSSNLIPRGTTVYWEAFTW